MGRTNFDPKYIPSAILCLCLSVNIDLIKKHIFLYSKDLFLKYFGLFGDNDDATAAAVIADDYNDDDDDENNNQNYTVTTSLVICQTHFKISGLTIHIVVPSFISFASS